MLITDSQPGIYSGKFIPDASISSNPGKTPMKADIVIPNLEIDSSVLFQPGQVGLQAQAVKGELDKVVQFVRVFNASKLIVEGHTDFDGDERQNQALSEQRAGMIRDFLIDNYERSQRKWSKSRDMGRLSRL